MSKVIREKKEQTSDVEKNQSTAFGQEISNQPLYRPDCLQI